MIIESRHNEINTRVVLINLKQSVRIIGLMMNFGINILSDVNVWRVVNLMIIDKSYLIEYVDIWWFISCKRVVVFS